MSWWGKVIGGTLGAAVAGPIGALLGAAIGHGFDAGLNKLEADDWRPGNVDQVERSKLTFFTSTFLLMGYVAKADGRVTEHELDSARDIMSRMQLDEGQRQAAMQLFNQGKRREFDLNSVLEQLLQECGRQKNLLQMFLEIQIATALSDGDLHGEEQAVLLTIAQRLRFSRMQFEALLAQLVAQQHYRYREPAGAVSPKQKLIDAYQMLGVTENCPDDVIKKAYRRLMSQHHPDKLVAKGLPEEMMKLATEKTQEIRDAYELIKAHRETNRG